MKNVTPSGIKSTTKKGFQSQFNKYNTYLGQFSVNDVKVLTVADVPRIEKIKDEITTIFFGDNDVYEIVYNSYITLGIEDEGELIGALSVRKYPHVRTLCPCSWLKWAQNLFGIKYLNGVNTLWFSLIVFKQTYKATFLVPLIIYLFKEICNLRYLALFLAPNLTVKHLSFLTSNLQRVVTIVTSSLAPTIGLFNEKSFFKEYKIRKAVEEDNDDILPIIESYTASLTKHYGEYYISELLCRIKDNSRQVIVAEYKGYAVAVLILNDVINLDMIEEQFETAPFHNFCKHDSNHDLFKLDMNSGILKECDYYSDIGDKLTIKYSEQSEAVNIDGFNSTTFSANSLEQPSLDDFAFDISVHLSLKFDLSIPQEDDNSNISQASNETIFSVFLLNADDYDLKNKFVHKTSSTSIYPTYQYGKSSLRSAKSRPSSYHRQSNAFVVEVMAHLPEHEKVIESLTEAAFECFPDMDYCLMTTPPKEPENDALKHFVKISPRLNSNYPHELLALHKNAFKCSMQVRIAVADDAPYIKEFVNQMVFEGNAYEQFQDTIENPDSVLICLIMISLSQIVGFAVVSEQINLENIFAHFELHKWVNENMHNTGNVGVLENFLVYPVFHNYCNYFLGEIHAQLDYNLLCYMVKPGEFDSFFRERYLCNAFQSLIPVLPRKTTQYHQEVLKNLTPSSNITDERNMSSLFISMPRYLGIKKIEIGTRIVLVGNGETALSFLGSLIYPINSTALVFFTNLTVISPHSIPLAKEVSNIYKLMTIYCGQSTYRRVLNSSLRSHLNFVPGVMTSIDRQRKLVIINDCYHLPYDYLVLMCGEQFRMPKMPFHPRRKKSEYPDNAFVVNTENDIANSFSKLEQLFSNINLNKECKNYVIVYGKSLRTYACLSALIAYGIPKDFLMLIEPIDSRLYSKDKIFQDNLIFRDPEIGNAIRLMVKNLGITVYHGYKLTDWYFDQKSLITQIQIASNKAYLNINCMCMFVFDDKMISTKTLNAILKSGLVFDGKLVIDRNFRTNDPYIYAAGSMTKYSRKYVTEEMNHIYFNPHEIGEHLANYFRRLLVPSRYRKHSKNKTSSVDILKSKVTLPIFTRPIIVNCSLPEKIYYLNVSDPGRFVPMEFQLNKENFGEVLTTGDVNDLNKQGFFRIHLNDLGIISSITCLSKKPIDVYKIVQLHGKDVVLFNNLLQRYKNSNIKDFFEFFDLPFTYGIIFDKFNDLTDVIKKTVMSHKIDEKQTFGEIFLHYHFACEHNQDIEDLLRKFGLVEIIEQKVLNYIEDNPNYLCMYAYSDLVKQILRNYKQSPLFFTKK